MPVPKQKKDHVKSRSSNIKYRSALDAQADRLVHTMENLVAPGEGEPTVFPGNAPSRAGTARYRLGLTVTATADRKSFGIECTPSLAAPLKVTSLTGLEGVSPSVPIGSRLHTLSGKVVDLVSQVQIDGQAVFVASEDRYDTVVMPFQNTNSNPQLTFSVALSNYAGYIPGDFTITFYNDGVAEVFASQTMSNETTHRTFILTSTAASAAERFVTYSFTGKGAAEFEIEVLSTVGSFQFPSSQGKMSFLSPDWNDLIADAARFRICAMDCLVTYHGSALNNAGSIAACNVDSSIPIVTGLDGDCSYYNTAVQRPFDRYSGRLASEGETEGGAHWLYFPDTAEQLLLESPGKLSNHDVPIGLIGIDGMSEGGVFRIECNFIVNFYSELPKFYMAIQPPMALFNVALAMTRKNVDVVSSNDSHVNKLKKVGKSAFSGASKLARTGLQFIKDNPELVAGHALELLV